MVDKEDWNLAHLVTLTGDVCFICLWFPQSVCVCVCSAKLVPLAYGIKKLQIACVVEDDKVRLGVWLWATISTYYYALLHLVIVPALFNLFMLWEQMIDVCLHDMTLLCNAHSPYKFVCVLATYHDCLRAVLSMRRKSWSYWPVWFASGLVPSDDTLSDYCIYIFIASGLKMFLKYFEWKMTKKPVFIARLLFVRLEAHILAWPNGEFCVAVGRVTVTAHILALSVNWATWHEYWLKAPESDELLCKGPKLSIWNLLLLPAIWHILFNYRTWQSCVCPVYAGIRDFSVCMIHASSDVSISVCNM